MFRGQKNANAPLRPFPFRVGLCALMVAVLVFSCSRPQEQAVVLYDFESETELDKLTWECHVLYALATDHATSGNRSLRADLYPSPYPAVVMPLTVRDWRPFARLSFDVYNPSDKALRIGVGIDDERVRPSYGDRYNRSFSLRPGDNHLIIPLETVIATGSRRQLELAHIYRMFILVAFPATKTTLYVDAVRLSEKRGNERQERDHSLR